ncbi:helix-turn-helix domain-containing protein [Asaia spathodeae]|uniref:Helix-turn-helix transcriptional regulator n=1 Tax=Asaia spathodeae TaxID=657016 RepID=A0ABX2P7A1_9PROT|nr:helix-turn-helix transcriptional regulator [Asaia spathodeae]GBR19684.1 putative transcriptional regulator [Asaia spathodeae NBRC 105894]
MTLVASQCRAARAMLGLSQRDLARMAEMAHRTVADFETDARTPHIRTLRAMRETLEACGAVFIPADEQFGPGVRLKAVGETKTAAEAETADTAETASQKTEPS